VISPLAQRDRGRTVIGPLRRPDYYSGRWWQRSGAAGGWLNCTERQPTGPGPVPLPSPWRPAAVSLVSRSRHQPRIDHAPVMPDGNPRSQTTRWLR